MTSVSTSSAAPGPRYRIDELARLTGTTVRNIRVFQAKGIVRPPRLEGRTGYYGEWDRLAVGATLRLQDRGFSLAGVSKLIEAWREGDTLADVLGLPLAPANAPAPERPAAGSDWDATFEEFEPRQVRLALVPSFVAAS